MDWLLSAGAVVVERTLVTTGEYAGVVRVVVSLAMSARMDPRALCRSPWLCAKKAEFVPPLRAMHWRTQQGPICPPPTPGATAAGRFGSLQLHCDASVPLVANCEQLASVALS